MVVGETIAAGAAGAHSIFSYNRGNFFYDKKQRQESEYQILEWRGAQAELWRDDIRDIIGLTEKKMDSYLVVATLTCTMCVGLFTEGRLEPGTPPWLLHLYMLTLGSAFMYLIMAVWFAMHASIVASCSEVRLLTQFVRLPVPTWQQLENMRTYAESFEVTRPTSMLRIPFAGKSRKVAVGDSTRSSADPWGLESVGLNRQIYELQEQPAALRRHVQLARRAARQYQSYDAFARVAMTFGINQLLPAVAYYCLGYVAIQDGSPVAAFCIVVITSSIALGLVSLDFSLTVKETRLAQVLVVGGPLFSFCATCAHIMGGVDAEGWVIFSLPLAYACHGFWLLFALSVCGMQVMPNGAVLPTKFRAVLYLDVFGWLAQNRDADTQGVAPLDAAATAAGAVAAAACARAQSTLTGKRRSSSKQLLPTVAAACAPASPARNPSSQKGARPIREDPGSIGTVMSDALRESLQKDLMLWDSQAVKVALAEPDLVRVQDLVRRAQNALSSLPPLSAKSAKPDSSRSTLSSVFQCSAPELEPLPLVLISGYTDFGLEIPYILNPATGEMCLEYAVSPCQDIRSISSFGELVTALERYTQTAEEEWNKDATAPEISSAAVCCVCPGPGAILDTNIGAKHEKYSHGTPLVHGTTEPSPPSGEVRADALGDAFGPTSYAPGTDLGNSSQKDGYRPYDPQSVIEDAYRNDPEGDIVTGHDRIHPGKLPGKIFRSATLMVALLWVIGLALPFGIFREFMTKPLLADVVVEEVGPNGRGHRAEVQAAIGQGPDGLPELIPYHVQNLPHLIDEEIISVDWPTHAGFVPRSLSSDSSGTHLVVADDLGLYAGRVGTTVQEVLQVPGLVDAPLPDTGPNFQRGTGVTAASSITTAAVRFVRVPPCTALEGEALLDVGVVCPTIDQESCRVLALHAHGRILSECPLHPPRHTDPTPASRELTEEEGDEMDDKDEDEPLLTKQSASWHLSDGWMHAASGKNANERERVDAVAVNGACIKDGSDSNSLFEGGVVGCVVAGTSQGRIVQLRGTVADEHRLVPERAMEHRGHSIAPGSLHIFSGGLVLALRTAEGTLQAFESTTGAVAGEWRLPPNVQWLTLCGGGHSLFVLGLRNGTLVELHRFSVPEVISQNAELRTPMESTVSSAPQPPRANNQAWPLRGLKESVPPGGISNDKRKAFATELDILMPDRDNVFSDHRVADHSPFLSI